MATSKTTGNDLPEALRQEITELEAHIEQQRAEFKQAEAAHSVKSKELARLKRTQADLSEKLAGSLWAEYDEMAKPIGSPSRGEMLQMRRTWKQELERVRHDLRGMPDDVRHGSTNLNSMLVALEKLEASSAKRIKQFRDFLTSEREHLAAIGAAERELDRVRQDRTTAAENVAIAERRKCRAVKAIRDAERAASELDRLRRDAILADAPDERTALQERTREAEARAQELASRAASVRAAHEEIEARIQAARAGLANAENRVTDAETALEHAKASLVRSRARRHAFDLLNTLGDRPEASELQKIVLHTGIALLDRNGRLVAPI